MLGSEVLTSGLWKRLARWRQCIAYQKKKPDQVN